MKKCEHGYYLGPNGEHIIPKDQAVPIADIVTKHNDHNNLIISGPYARKRNNINKDVTIQELRKELGLK